MSDKLEQKQYNDIMYNIYKDEDRREKVKDNFKFFSKIIRPIIMSKEHISICDVGCATGDLLWFLRKEFRERDIDFSGIDIEKDYLEIAKKRMPDVNFVYGNVMEDKDLSTGGGYDIVTFFGVLSFFEDFEPIMSRLLRLVKHNGYLYVFTYFNPRGFKVKYEYTYKSNKVAVTHFDVAHSIEEISAYLDCMSLNYSWHKFTIQTEIPRCEKKIPLRVYTQKMADGSLMQRDDIARIQEQYLLEIEC